MPSADRQRRLQLLNKRPTLQRILVGGWSWSRTLRIVSHEAIEKYKLYRTDEYSPYESVVLSTGERVDIRDASQSRCPGERVHVLVDRDERFQIQWAQAFMAAPQFTCFDRLLNSVRIVSRVGGQRWYQHDFFADEAGDLQIDASLCVYFASSCPSPLAIGLQLLLDARLGH